MARDRFASGRGNAMAGSVYEGKTFDEAVRKGLDALRLSRAEAVITTVEEGKGGFLGFGARPFRVSVARRPGGAIKEPAERGGDERRGGKRNEREARTGRGTREAAPHGRGERSSRVGRDERPARAGRDERPAKAGRDERSDRGGREEKDDREPKAQGRREERGGREERAPREARPPREDKVAREERAPRERAPREERRPASVQAAAPSPVPPSVADGGDDDSPRKRRRRGRRGGRGRRRGGAGEEDGDVEAATAPVMMNGVEASEHEMLDTPRSAPVAAPAAATPAPPMPATSTEPVMARLAPEPVAEPDEQHAPESQEPIETRAGVAAGDERPGGRPERDPREGRRERFRGRHEHGGEARERSEAPDMTSEELIATSRKITEDLLRAMGFEPRITVRAEGNRVDVTVEVDQDENLLNGRQGETRQSLQHLLNRFLNKGDGSRYHLQLEVNDFWQQRELELADLARGMADDAITRNAEVVSDYLNSQERRILHVTLKEDLRVRTFSLGTGMLKRVAVAPASFPDRSEDESAS